MNMNIYSLYKYKVLKRELGVVFTEINLKTILIVTKKCQKILVALLCLPNLSVSAVFLYFTFLQHKV